MTFCGAAAEKKQFPLLNLLYCPGVARFSEGGDKLVRHLSVSERRQRSRDTSWWREMRLTALLGLPSKVIKLPRDYRFGTSRPSTVAAQKKNPPGKRRSKIFVEPVSNHEWAYFRGDTVEVLFGKDTGKQGKVSQVIRARNWVVVENLNTHYRYVGKSGDYRGTYVPSEAPLLLNQVALVDPTDRKPTEVEWRYTEEGERVRVSLRTGRIIPKPVFQRRDGIIPEQWKDGPKDTSVEDALERTYVPSLKTFQEEIMNAMGIVENRRHRKSFWY